LDTETENLDPLTGYVLDPLHNQHRTRLKSYLPCSTISELSPRGEAWRLSAETPEGVLPLTIDYDHKGKRPLSSSKIFKGGPTPLFY
jgi:hypothetical protein